MDYVDYDTIVCPAHEEGLSQIFLKEHRWYAVQMKKRYLSKIKFIGLYEKRPISAIQYIREIKEINSISDSKKYEITLTGKPKKIKPIKFSKSNPSLALQSRRYTTKKLIDNVRYLEDIFQNSKSKE